MDTKDSRNKEKQYEGMIMYWIGEFLKKYMKDESDMTSV